MNLFSFYEIEENTVYHWKSCSLNLWIKKVSSEWMIAYSHEKEKCSIPVFEISEKPSGIEWTRVISEKTCSRIMFKPSMPEKPVVVQSAEEIRILEKQKSSIKVRIPFNYRIYAESATGEQLLFEVPSEIMSKTWFGELLTGMLAYSLNTSIIIDRDYPPADNHVICTIVINNSAKKPFCFRKLSVPANSMNIYTSESSKASGFFTDNINVDFSDDERIKISLDSSQYKSSKRKIVYEAQKSIQDKYILIKEVTSFIKTVTGI